MSETKENPPKETQDPAVSEDPKVNENASDESSVKKISIKKKRKLKKEKHGLDLYKAIGIPLVVLILMGGLALMGAVTELRIKELKLAMQNLDDSKGSGRSLGLIVRYNMIKNRIINKTESSADYLNEGEMMAVLSGEFDDKALSIDYFRFMEKPATMFVNALSFFLGDKPIQNFRENKGNKLMEVAYFFERKRNFKKAVKVYEAAVGHFEGEPKSLAYIYLHRGFCLSLTGAREGALKDYDLVIGLVPNSEMQQTAKKLKSFLTEIQSKLIEVEKLVTSVIKGKAFYDLMAYNKAIETMNEMERNNIRTQKLYFYRGRAYEEIGNSKMALKDYRKVISISQNTSLAKNANRRIFILGSYYSTDDKLQTESKKNAVVMKDESFIKKSEFVAKIVDTKKVSEIKKDVYTKKTIEFVNEKTDANLEVPKVVEVEDTFSMSSGVETTKEVVVAKKELEDKNIDNQDSITDNKKASAEAKKLKLEGDALLLAKNYDGAIAKYTLGKTTLERFTSWDSLISKVNTEKSIAQKKKVLPPSYTPAQIAAYKKQREEYAKKQAEKMKVLREEARKLKNDGDEFFKTKRYDAAVAIYVTGRTKLPSYTNWNAHIRKAWAAKKKANQESTATTKKKSPRQLISDPKTSKADRKNALKRMGKLTKVFTQDGNVFVGAILSQTDTHLYLATVFGNIKVPKEQIAMQLKVDSKVEIK